MLFSNILPPTRNLSIYLVSRKMNNSAFTEDEQLHSLKHKRIYYAAAFLPVQKYPCRETRGPHTGWSWSRELRAAPNDSPRRPGDCCCRRRWPRWPLACYAPSCLPACCAVAAVVVAAAVVVGYGAAILQCYPPHSHWRSGLPGRRHHYLPSTKFFSVGGIYLIQKHLGVKRSPSIVECRKTASNWVLGRTVKREQLRRGAIRLSIYDSDPF